MKWYLMMRDYEEFVDRQNFRINSLDTDYSLKIDNADIGYNENMVLDDITLKGNSRNIFGIIDNLYFFRIECCLSKV